MDESIMKIAATLLLCVLPVIAAAQASAPAGKPPAKQNSGNPVWTEESTPNKSTSTKSRGEVKGELNDARKSGAIDQTNADSYGQAPPAKGKAPKPTQTRKEAKDEYAAEKKAGKATPQNDETYGAPGIAPPPKTKKSKAPAASAP
jgi:hypothetical protein